MKLKTMAPCGLGLVLLMALLPGRPVFAQSVSGLLPLLQVESSGVTLRRFDIFLCDICDSTTHLREARQMTIFTNRSLVAVTSTNNLDDPAGTTATVVTGTGARAAFAQLVQALAAAGPFAGQPGCSVPFDRDLPSPRPDVNLSLSINHDYRLTAYDAGNRLRTFTLDSAGPRCPAAVRDLVLKAVQYFESVAGR